MLADPQASLHPRDVSDPGLRSILIGRRNMARLMRRDLRVLFRCLLLGWLIAGLAPVSGAQSSVGPQPVPLPPPIVAPADTPYPGTISLTVDMTVTNRRVVSVHESIPVAAGELTLLYPEWIPGDHSPTGPISRLASINITANGKRIGWVRDRVNVYAFHVVVPDGVRALDVDFDYLSPVRGSEGRISISTEMADLAWDTVVLYPAGHFSRRITVAPSLRLPDGWQFATALDVQSREGGVIHFKDTTLNTLVDSPVYAGSHSRRFDLSTDATNIVHLNVFADTEADLAITPVQLQLERNLVSQAAKLYASHHYDHYDFLFLLSDKVGGIGLEHHQSSEDGSRANFFTDWAAGVPGRDLLAHEYTHSWNGKFRRPADLWTPNFNVPMQDDLLWVYEGMTQYYGNVLTARAGLRTAAQTRDIFAQTAANFDASPGREWRPLIDTTNQPTMSMRSPVPWVSFQRTEDYYNEGLLIWLDADTKIRELSGDKKSLDDFARLFLGIDNGSYITHTYTFDDVVAALNTVQPYDWAAFLHDRVDKLSPQTPKDGLTRGGYMLTYSDTAPDWRAHVDDKLPESRSISFATSIGFSLQADGMLSDVSWGGAAFKAGMTADMKILAVNGEVFKLDKLRSAILDAEKSKEPIQLVVKRGDEFENIAVDYHDGMRYPTLKRIEGTPDRLDAILSPTP
jgi:predicted metalloprotease with PDZ domain